MSDLASFDLQVMKIIRAGRGYGPMSIAGAILRRNLMGDITEEERRLVGRVGKACRRLLLKDLVEADWNYTHSAVQSYRAKKR